MFKITAIILISMVLTINVALATPIELMCEAHVHSCTGVLGAKKECGERYSKWVFKFKTLLGRDTRSYSFLINEDSITINGYRRFPLFKSIAPDKIEIGLGYDRILDTKIVINRLNGELVYEDIHTDGSIKEIPVGMPYTEYFGYCSSDIKRKF